MASVKTKGKRELNPNAKKWVAALRSGKYRQCRSSLTRNGAYCCLGVALVVAEESGVCTSIRDAGIGLTSEAQSWLGLAGYDGRYLDSSLMTDNDDHGKSFSEIADIIESQPEGLFR